MDKSKLFYIVFVSLIIGELSNAEMKLSAVSEGHCIHPSPKPIKFDIVWAMEFGAEAKYVPMASELYFVYTSLLLRGKSIKNVDEISKMCINIDSSGFSSSISAFGVKKNLECEIRDIGALMCGTPEEMNDESLSDDQRNSTLVVVTWTDHKNYLVTYNCFPGGMKSWNVVSNRKTVDEAAKTAIYKHIKSFGFDTKKAQESGYKSC